MKKIKLFGPVFAFLIATSSAFAADKYELLFTHSHLELGKDNYFTSALILDRASNQILGCNFTFNVAKDVYSTKGCFVWAKNVQTSEDYTTVAWVAEYPSQPKETAAYLQLNHASGSLKYCPMTTRGAGRCATVDLAQVK